ncbi:hypothetical protein C1H46_014181 [Malus baccata]|uniref:Uncharacterized protein n=1 Tax=Malus baccata TaxID=106549 RepID=A0A540MN07_MALBA|nr:hypothetical protein C1H46_014181 [Malus baccata]
MDPFPHHECARLMMAILIQDNLQRGIPKCTAQSVGQLMERSSDLYRDFFQPSQMERRRLLWTSSGALVT